MDGRDGLPRRHPVHGLGASRLEYVLLCQFSPLLRGWETLVKFRGAPLPH